MPREFSLAGLALLALIVTATATAATARWYTAAQAARGRDIYVKNCAACHGTDGEGQPDWDKQDEMGYYPPPPLDRSGHAWHHPLADLLNTLQLGGGPSGGTMPSFSGVLDDAGKHDVLAYIQSRWPDEMYESWAAIDRGEVKPPAMPGHEH